MNKVFFFIYFFLFPSFLFSQDTLIKANGDLLLVKVIEINPLEIKYKRFDFLDGPVYVNHKQNVKSLNLAGGVIENFIPIKEPAVRKRKHPSYYAQTDTIIVKGNVFIYMEKKRSIYDVSDFLKSKISEPENEIANLIKISNKAYKREKYYTAGFIALGVSTIVCMVMVPEEKKFLFPAIPLAVGTAFCIYSQGRFHKKRYTLTKQAVHLYNQRF
jgi:hypothetical protein